MAVPCHTSSSDTVFGSIQLISRFWKMWSNLSVFFFFIKNIRFSRKGHTRHTLVSLCIIYAQRRAWQCYNGENITGHQSFQRAAPATAAPSQTCLLFPKVFPQEGDEAILQQQEENGRKQGRQNWQWGTGMVAAPWNCSSHYSAFRWGTTPLSLSHCILLHVVNHHIYSHISEDVPEA